jgi:hypothetical protein
MEDRGQNLKRITEQLAEAGITLRQIALIEEITGVEILYVTRPKPPPRNDSWVSANDTSIYAQSA